MKGGETGKKLKHNKNIQEQKNDFMAQETKLQKNTWMKCDSSKSKNQIRINVKPSRHLLTGLDKVYSA